MGERHDGVRGTGRQRLRNRAHAHGRRSFSLLVPSRLLMIKVSFVCSCIMFFKCVLWFFCWESSMPLLYLHCLLNHSNQSIIQGAGTHQHNYNIFHIISQHAQLPYLSILYSSGKLQYIYVCTVHTFRIQEKKYEEIQIELKDMLHTHTKSEYMLQWCIMFFYPCMELVYVQWLA